MKHLLFTSKIFKGSKYGEGHPLNIDRVWPSLELLKKMRWIDKDEVIFNDIAFINDLLLFHDKNYIEALNNQPNNPTFLSYYAIFKSHLLKNKKAITHTFYVQ